MRRSSLATRALTSARSMAYSSSASALWIVLPASCFRNCAGILVRVDGHARGELRGLVQPRGIGSADVDPRLEGAGQIANGDRRLVWSRDTWRELDPVGELHQIGDHSRDEILLGLGGMARDAQRHRFVDTTVGVREVDVDVVDRCGEGHPVRERTLPDGDSQEQRASRLLHGDRWQVSRLRLATARLPVQHPPRGRCTGPRSRRREAADGEEGARRQDRHRGVRVAAECRVPERSQSGAEACVRNGWHGDRRRRGTARRCAPTRARRTDEARVRRQRLLPAF